VRLSASQVIERPPAEVFRFVATEHFQNHPKWDPAVVSITKTSPGPMGVGTTARLVRTDRGRHVEGGMEVTQYEPVSRFTEVSRFGPFTLHARATLEPVAPASTRLELVIDTPRPWGHPVAASADARDLPQDDGEKPSHHQAAYGSDRVPHDLTRVKPQRDLLHAVYGPAAQSRPNTAVGLWFFGCPLGTVIDRWFAALRRPSTSSVWLSNDPTQRLPIRHHAGVPCDWRADATTAGLPEVSSRLSKTPTLASTCPIQVLPGSCHMTGAIPTASQPSFPRSFSSFLYASSLVPCKMITLYCQIAVASVLLVSFR
jgi:Polyketide cyclase / dehydrase and lipid transport